MQLDSKASEPAEKDLVLRTKFMADALAANGKVINCTATKKPIYKTLPDGLNVALSSHGFCIDCSLPFSEEYLKFPEGTDRCSWIVVHTGRYCKDCWNKDD